MAVDKLYMIILPTEDSPDNTVTKVSKWAIDELHIVGNEAFAIVQESAAVEFIDMDKLQLLDLIVTTKQGPQA